MVGVVSGVHSVNLRAGHNALHTNIVTVAQIRPPHCTISCLASRSAISTVQSQVTYNYYTKHCTSNCTHRASYLAMSTAIKAHFLSRHRSAETQCWMRRYVRGTWYVRRFSQCARASAACMLYTLNRVSNVFITCN